MGDTSQDKAAGRRGPLTEETAAFLLTCEVCRAGAELRVSLRPKSGRVSIKPQDVCDAFQRLGIRGTIDQVALQQVCEAASQGRPQTDALLVTAIPPQPATAAHVEFLVQASTDEVILAEHGDGLVDHHQLAHFQNVEAEQKLAVVHPANPGVPGTLVTGEAIAAPEAAGGAIIYKAGENVRLDVGQRAFFSTAAGRVVFDKRQQTVSVSDKYVVKGDGDLHVGDIDFRGSVEIQGDVLKDFKVKATKTLKVRGTVEGAFLYAGGDITIGHGMTGGKVICGGNLTARFLDSVEVECAGNLTVNNEIINCNICCQGLVSAPNGMLIGGKCEARMGVEAKEIGSTGHPVTTVVVGLFGPELASLRGLEEKLVALAKAPGPLPAAAGTVSPTPQRELLEAEIKRLRAGGDRANFILNITIAIHPGVTISLGGCTAQFEQRVDGPKTLVPDPERAALLLLSRQAISSRATDIQNRVLQERRAAEAARAEARAKDSSAPA